MRWSAPSAAPTRRSITEARLFDRYEGEQGLSLAVEVTLQPGEKSFTDAEIAEVSQARSSRRPRSWGRRSGRLSALIAAWTRASISSRFRPGGMTSPTLKWTVPRSLDEALVPQPADVVRDRHDRQAERAIEAGEARLERRRLAERDARSFGKDDHRRPAGDRRLGLGHHLPQRAGPGLPVDADDAVAARHPAEQAG